MRHAVTRLAETILQVPISINDSMSLNQFNQLSARDVISPRRKFPKMVVCNNGTKILKRGK